MHKPTSHEDYYIYHLFARLLTWCKNLVTLPCLLFTHGKIKNGTKHFSVSKSKEFNGKMRIPDSELADFVFMAGVHYVHQRGFSR